jgi:diadenosine tetraphosphate (Ap4A) HIT family hydrolase
MRPCPLCELPNHRIIKEYEYWTLAVAESQQLLGYLVIVLKEHKEFLVDLSDEQWLEFKQVAKDAQKALDAAFQPDWYNYQQLGNLNRHLHVYLIPRYKVPRIFEGRQFIDERFGKQAERRWVFEEEEFLTKLAKKLQEKLE